MRWATGHGLWAIGCLFGVASPAVAQDPGDLAATRDWLERNLVRLAPAASPQGQGSLAKVVVDSCRAMRITWQVRPRQGAWRTVGIFAPISWDRITIKPAPSLPQGHTVYSGDPKGGQTRTEFTEAWPAGTTVLYLSYKEKVVLPENPKASEQPGSAVLYYFHNWDAAEEAKGQLAKLRSLCEGRR